MAKEEKKEEKVADKAKVDEPAESGDGKSKKKKLILFGAIGLIATLAIGGGAAFFLSKGSKDKAMAAKTSDEHGDDKKKDEHGDDKKKDEHGDDKKKDEHGDDKKKDEHGDDKKKDDHGKPDEHGKPDDHGKPADDHGKPAAANGKDKKPELNIDFGQTFAFAAFHLNLGNPMENHYVRMEVTVEYGGGPEQEEELKRRIPQLRDAIVSVASRKSREFLLGPDGKDQLRLELKNRVNQYMTKKVENVYITDILIE